MRQLVPVPRAILDEYEGLCRYWAERFFAPGLESEDLQQEARVGLCEAYRDYRVERGMKFAPFAAECIRRQVMSAVTAAHREKHTALNSAQSLDEPVGEEGLTRGEMIPSTEDPHRTVCSRDLLARQVRILRRECAPVERAVVADVLNGRALPNPKSADNALQRVRHKLRDAA